MVTFFQNRELSEKLGIKLAKWKRWSREFLPPDPLGGMQSGYARQFSLDDAFVVYVGGYLVSELKFSIPEARQILFDLREWMLSHGFYTYHDQLNGKAPVPDGDSGPYHIHVSIPRNARGNPGPIHYDIRLPAISNPLAANGVGGEPEPVAVHLQGGLAKAPDEPAGEIIPSFGSRVVHLTELHRHFLDCLEWTGG